MGQIRVLIVDDSVLMRRVLSDLLQSDKQITVVGTAKDGVDAIDKVNVLHPDVVTMDIEMPNMDGLTAVQRIMESFPVPIIMISALTQRETQLTLKALDCGAVDYVPKPSGPISMDMAGVRDELISKVKVAASAKIIGAKIQALENMDVPARFGDRIISIAASTGGPPALTHVLSALPSEVPPILIVQHMPKGITKFFADGLNEKCKFRVKEAEEGDSIQPCLALVAPGGFHMTVTKEKRISLNLDPMVNYVRPSADVLLVSAAEYFGSKNVSVILTGMGSDGANGIKLIKGKGGFTIAQDQKTSVVYGMPRVAAETGCVDSVVPLELIPKEIMKACI